MHGVLGEPARLDRGEVALQLCGRQLIQSPDGPFLEVAVDMLPVPVDRLRASAQHLQVEQPLTDQRLKVRRSVTVRRSWQRRRCGLLVSILGDDDGAKHFLLYGTRLPWQPLRPAHGQKPKWSLEWFRVFRRPSGFRKTQYPLTFSRHLHLSFSAA